MKEKKWRIQTLAVHGGEFRDKEHYPLTTPIYQTATYIFENTEALIEFFEGRTNRLAEYGRYGNPTQEAAQNKLKALEGAEACLLFSTGMNAVTTTILAIARKGDHIIITNDSYRRTRQFILEVISKYGVSFDIVEPKIEAIERAITPKTKLIISESPTNPYLRVLDLKRLAEVAKTHRIKTLIDSTFATPYNQRPLEFGIDLVVHSVTKYLAGHNDILGGALLGKKFLVDAIKSQQAILGGILDPHSCYLLLRGLKTFPLRISYQNQSALKIAKFLEEHPKVERVFYPGLPSHPDHQIAKEQMKGFGGVISFLIKGDLKTTSYFIDSLKIPKIAPSLGGVESLIEQPALMSYFELTKEERSALGIYENLVRLSVGVEDTQDLIEDLAQALEKI